MDERKTRPTLTTPSDPNDAARPEADEAPEVEPVPEPEAAPAADEKAETSEAEQKAEAPAGDEDVESPRPDQKAKAPGSDQKAEAPGVGEAIGGVRAAFMRMLDAHVTLLRAELEIAGREIGIIAGLAIGALVIALLVLGLVYIGAFLFIGEWLFGSMGWGIIHGTLLGLAIIGFVGINLAGGDVRAYAAGAAIGVAATIVLAAVLLSNVSNEAGEAMRRWIVGEFQTEGLPFGEEWLVLLSGIVIGAIIGGVVALIASWRSQAGHPFAVLMTGLFAGGFIGAIWFPTRYQAADGVLGLAIMVGLLTWIAAGIALAARRGFDPEARYANLVPRESIAAFQGTKEFLSSEWERQKDRMMGR